MVLTDVSSKADFQTAVGSGQPVVAHFWATWCEPCKHMDVVLRQLAAENTHAKFLRVEAEEQPEISEEYGVASVPLFLFFKGSKLVDRLEGANAPELAHKVAVNISGPNAHPGSSSGVGATASPAQIINTLQQTLASTAPPNTNGVPLANGSAGGGVEDGQLSPGLKARLEKLVGSETVLLFMKGSSDSPRCGFSSKVVAVLREIGVPFGSFDILSDDDVRQGMKLFSDWPTFPQLYAGGELVGGCDIVLEMHRSGELKKTLEAATAASAVKPVGGAEQESSAASGGEGGAGGKEKLEALITSSPTMLFMKGSPSAPQCGFSRRVVAALEEEGVSFGSFDILSDESVRQGLKTLSDWPTYPQLYHKGEFVGGCDIVMELKKNGELKTTLSA